MSLTSPKVVDEFYDNSRDDIQNDQNVRIEYVDNSPQNAQGGR